MKTKFLTPLAAVALAATSAAAAPVSPEQAVATAAEFLKAPVARKAASRAASSRLKIADTYEFSGKTGCYIVAPENGDGFVIVGSDSRTGVLGYSDSGVYDRSQIPCGLRMMLDAYAAETANMPESYDPAASVSRVTKATRRSVAPLLTTKWDQSTPYNGKCPQSSFGRMPTGCVATAMSQVMKYHEWPREGKDLQYTDHFDPSPSYDYSQPFQWDQMLDAYSMSGSTKSQRDAVANLMLACGVAVDMQYRTSSSGAFSCFVPDVARDFFSYDKGIEYIDRSTYDPALWDDLIYGEIAAGRPVIYGGVARDGGHEFVCDGYESDGYFHINWGWGGSYDGFFRLGALEPEGQGTGGYEGGYNLRQHAIIGIQPPVDDSVGTISVFLNGYITASKENDKVTFSSNKGGSLSSMWREKITFTPAVRFIAGDGKSHDFVFGSPVTTDAMSYEGIYGKTPFICDVKESEILALADGIYTVVPAYVAPDTDGKTLHDLNYFPSAVLKATVKDGEVVFNTEGHFPEDKISTDGINLVTPLRQGQAALVDMEISNNDLFDFSGTLFFALFPATTDTPSPSDALETYDSESCSLTAATSHNLQTTIRFDATQGKYTLALFCLRDGSSEPSLVATETVDILSPLAGKGDGDLKVLWVYPDKIYNSTDNYVTIGIEAGEGFDQTLKTRIELIEENASYPKVGASSAEIYDAAALARLGAVRIKIRTNDITSPAGIYNMIIHNEENGKLSPLSKNDFSIEILGCPDPGDNDFIWYSYDKTTDAASVAGSIRRGTMNVEVKPEIDVIGNGTAVVKSVDADAFNNAGMLRTVILPETIENVGEGAFAGLSSLRDILFQSPTPPFADGASVFGSTSGAWICVPAGSYDAYRAALPSGLNLDEWAEKWNYSIEEGKTPVVGTPLEILMSANSQATHLRPATFDIATDVPAVCTLEVNNSRMSEGIITLTLTADTECTATLTPVSTQPLVEATPYEVKFSDPVGVDQVSGNDMAYPVDVYSTEGVLIKRASDRESLLSLPAGIYITGGRKIVITNSSQRR